LGILESHCEPSGGRYEVKKASGGEYPQKEGGTQTPNQSRTRTRGAPGEKESKGKPKR
jgi:hypothetical protein